MLELRLITPEFEVKSYNPTLVTLVHALISADTYLPAWEFLNNKYKIWSQATHSLSKGTI